MKWKAETNCNRKKLKLSKYKSCKNPCLVNCHESDTIFDIFYIPVLHTIKLGPVNKLYKELSSKVNLTTFVNNHCIQKSQYNGDTLESIQKHR